MRFPWTAAPAEKTAEVIDNRPRLDDIIVVEKFGPQGDAIAFEVAIVFNIGRIIVGRYNTKAAAKDRADMLKDQLK